MDTILHMALSNAIVAGLLAIFVMAFSRVCRRPALVHSLWLLVLLKLVTPAFWPINLPWPQLTSATVAQAEPEGLFPTTAASPASADVPAARLEADEEADSDDLEPVSQPEPAPALLPSAAIASAPDELVPEISDPPAAARAFDVPWKTVLVSGWLAGSACWFALAAVRLLRFSRSLPLLTSAPTQLQAQAEQIAARLGMMNCPRLTVIPAAVSPMLWALGGASRLLVPAALVTSLSKQQWDTLLAHELAHLRRRDHWVRLLELAAQGLYWWHPAVWLARRELREAEEQCCDAWVVWALPDAADTYATALLETVTFLSHARPALPVAASGIGHVRLLKRRLTMIMRGTTPRTLSRAGFYAVTALGALLLTILPGWAQTGAAEDEDAPPRTAGRQDNRPGEEAASPPRAGAGFGRGRGNSGEAPSGGRPAMRREQGSDNRPFSEQLEDARDEIDLLKVQLMGRRAELQEAEARSRQAHHHVDRVKRLAANGAIDNSEVEQAATDNEVQEARVKSKQAQVAEGELRLKQATRRLSRIEQGSRPRGGMMGMGGGMMGMGGGMMAGPGGGGPAGMAMGGMPPGAGGGAGMPAMPGAMGRGAPGGFPGGPPAGASGPGGGGFGGEGGPGGFPGGPAAGASGPGGRGFGGAAGPGMAPGSPAGAPMAGTASGSGRAGMAGGRGGSSSGGDMERRLELLERQMREILQEVKKLRSSSSRPKDDESSRR